MSLTDQLSKLSLKLPSLYYKKPEGPYTPQTDQTFGLDPSMVPQPNVQPMQPVMTDTSGNVMGGDPYPNGAPQGQVMQPGNYGQPNGPTGLDALLQNLAESLHAQAGLVPPVATQPHHLNDSQAGIPLAIAALASLDPTVRRDGSAQNFLHNVLGGFNANAQQEAQRQDQLSNQAYFQQKGNLGVDSELAKMKYESAAATGAENTKLQNDLTKIGAEGQVKKDLQAGKDQAAINLLHETIKTLPEKEQAKYMGTFNAYKAMNPSATDEQAASYAMSQHFAQIASGNLANTQSEDIKATREARIDAITSGAEVNRSRAALLDKEYENFDDTQAIKLALLKVQIESLGLKFQGDQYKNDPNKLEYDQLDKDHAVSDRNIKEYQRLAKEAADVLNDVVKSATISPEEKARLTAQRDTNAAKAKAELKHLDGIDARMKALTKKITERVGSTLPPNPAASRGGRPASLPGYVPVDPTGSGYERIRTAADALDQLGL